LWVVEAQRLYGLINVLFTLAFLSCRSNAAASIVVLRGGEQVALQRSRFIFAEWEEPWAVEQGHLLIVPFRYPDSLLLPD